MEGRKMKSQLTLCLTIGLLCVASGVAQSQGKPPNSAAVTDIRKVDFLNSTYQSSLAHRNMEARVSARKLPYVMANSRTRMSILLLQTAGSFTQT
jgi:hypothetical protein